MFFILAMSPLRTGFTHLGDKDFSEEKGEGFLSMTREILGMVGRVGMLGIFDILSVEDFLIKILGDKHA